MVQVWSDRIVKAKLFAIFRVFFGIVLMVWVGMGVFGWEPPPVSSESEKLRDAIFESGYIIPSVLTVYFVAGISFLLNRFAPLASVLLFPVSLNIFMFHSFMNPNARSLSIAGALLAANCVLIYRYRQAYLPILKSVE